MYPGWAPPNNALIGNYKGRFRDECLNTNWFLSLEDDRAKIKTWGQKQDCKGSRPYTYLGSNTTLEFACFCLSTYYDTVIQKSQILT
ncbi:integrase core domain-containing protein [Dethiosulfatarculus sandiegensis]|uniref:integrase core domain-containing protein n=1 Tax=Dethiosulfatarculus sandiegensis TaxID=1429043 RepID=UPI0012E308FF